MSVFQSLDDAEHHDQSSTIVTDARSLQHGTFAFDLDIRAFGKNRVQMCRENQIWMRRRAGARPDYVASFIDVDVCQAELVEQSLQFAAARFFVERRSRDLTNPHLFIDEVRLVPLRRV